MTKTNDQMPSGLQPLHAMPPLRKYVDQLWQRRTYAIRMPLRELRARNMNNVLGLSWFLLNPMLLVAVYYTFFGLIIGTDRGVDNFLTFLASGVFTYSFLQRTMTSASRTVVTNVGLIRAIRFPRALLPITETVEQSLAHIPVVAVLFLVALLTGEPVRLSWVLMMPLVMLQASFALGVGFILARITTNFRDLQNFMPFGFRLVFYMSGVLYSIDAFVADVTIRRLFFLNPFFDNIKLVRFAILGGEFPAWAALGTVISAVVMLPVGFTIFRRGEPYGRA